MGPRSNEPIKPETTARDNWTMVLGAMINYIAVAVSSDKDTDQYLGPIVVMSFVWLNQNMSIAGGVA